MTVGRMKTGHHLEVAEALPTAFSGLQPQLKVVLVYEDFEMGVEGKRIFDLIAGEVGGIDAARLTVWRFDFFHSLELTDALSRQSEEADVIIVAPRDPHSLPPQVKRWLDHWSQHRKIASGALVSVFHPEAGPSVRGSNVALLLWRAANRAGMEFLCRSGTAGNLQSQGWFASPAGLLNDPHLRVTNRVPQKTSNH